jgi:PKHD-type hydroxylase
MFLTIEKLISETNRKKINTLLSEDSWEDGKLTAGPVASQVKINQQLNRSSTAYKSICAVVKKSLTDNYSFKSFSLAKDVHSLLVSKTTKGGKYGKHIDNPFINGKRTDLSFTIFLNSPSEYEGGFLLSEIFDDIKLEAGDAIVYPSSTLHEVTTVFSGTRFVCCGWVESMIKDPIQRGLLFDLNSAKMSLLEKHGKSEEYDLVSKSYSNLLRIWSV